MRSSSVSFLKPLAVASTVLWWAMPCDVVLAQKVREATTVQTFPDIEKEHGVDAICGIRVLYSASESPVDFDLYDLTIAMYVSEAQKGLTAVRAMMRKGNLSTDPNLVNAPRIPPNDMLFGVSPFRNPVGLRDRRTVDGILVATIDESKAPQAGAYGGALIRHLMNGDPILVFWGDGAGAAKAISIKTPNNQVVFDAMQNCLKGTLSLDD
jgi:hypothetical protein